AFVVYEGVLVTSCKSLSPNAQLSVELGTPKAIPARVSLTEPELGLCKLEVPSVGSWPLAVSDEPVKPGDRVYAAQLNTKGEVGLREIRVKNVKTVDNAT